MKLLPKLADRFAREPVLFFGALEAYLLGFTDIFNTDLRKGFLTAATLWLTRTFSTSKRTADENVEVGKWVGAVEAKVEPPSSE